MSKANNPRQEQVTIPAEFQQTIPFLEENNGVVKLSLKSAVLLELANSISSCSKEEATDLAMQIYRGIRIAESGIIHSGMVESENALITLSKALGTEEKIFQKEPNNVDPNDEKQDSVPLIPRKGFVFCYTIIDNQFQLIEIDKLLADLAKTYVNGSLKSAIDMSRDILTSFNYGDSVKACELMEVGQSITNFELSLSVHQLVCPSLINSTESEKISSDEDQDEYPDRSLTFVGKIIENIKNFFQFVIAGDEEDYEDSDNFATYLPTTNSSETLTEENHEDGNEGKQ